MLLGLVYSYGDKLRKTTTAMQPQENNRGYNIVIAAMEQVALNSQLLGCVLLWAYKGEALGRDVQVGIANSLERRQLTRRAHGTSKMDLNELSALRAETLATARLASQTAIQIREIIGDKPYLLHHAHNSTATTKPTMMSTHGQLIELRDILTMTAAPLSCSPAQLAILKAKLEAMSQLTHSNNQIALRTARAIEQLQWQAINFLRGIDKVYGIQSQLRK